MYEKGDLLNGRQIVRRLHFAESTGGMNTKTDVNYLVIVFSFAIARLYRYTDILNTSRRYL
jgi:hypothetical protein